MAEGAMKLEQEQLEQIGSYVRTHIAEWLPANAGRIDSDALARIEVDIAHVKEEVKANRVILEKHIEFTDKRFESLQHTMDKRFEDLYHNMDKRFEQVDSRFESMQHNMDRRFDELHRSIRNGQWFIGMLVTFVMTASTAVQILL